ncbi:MAG: glycosyltransferase [Candidatus Shapirobacteria bacterium]
MSNGTAIISDVVMKYGGAEKVLESILQIYPKSVLYTLFIVPSARKKLMERFPYLTIKTSKWQLFVRDDRVTKYISIIKVLSWIYWERLDLSGYDTVISSSHSFMSKNVRSDNNAFHLSYIHTPPRYLYDEFNEIEFIKGRIGSVLFWPIKKILRGIDKRGAKRPDKLVANSKNVQTRIKRYYGREVQVVYPPVDDFTLKKYFGRKRGDYYIWVSRLVKQKGIYQAVETCEQMGRKLIVVGGGDELTKLRQKKYKWVTFEGACSDEKKFQLMSKSKALIYTSVDEDFGIVPVESLMMGVPVIARNSGGVREVVREGVNGLLFADNGGRGLEKTIIEFEKKDFDRLGCRKSVSSFGQQIFMDKLRDIIKKGNDRKN